MNDCGSVHIDLVDLLGGLGAIVVLAGLAVAWITAPGPEDVSEHVEADAVRQVQIQAEREKRYAAVRQADSLERLVRECRIDRATLEASR